MHAILHQRSSSRNIFFGALFGRTENDCTKTNNS